MGDGPGSDAQTSPLDRCLLFQALEPADRRELADRAYRASYESGSPIFHLGDPGGQMMVVVVGTVRISLPTQPGKEIILDDLGPGELFGEVALLDGKDRSAAATALTNCQLLVLDRRHVVPFLVAHPRAAMSVIELLCGRLRHSDERMTDIAISHLPTRLAKTLINRVPDGTRRPPKLSLSQGELADMTGTSRESVNRTLRVWQQRGILEVRDGWIVIHRLDAVAALAGCV